MSVSKLRRVHVIIIGLVACVVVVAGLYFLVIRKGQERVGALEARRQAASAVVAQRSATESRLERARQDYAIASTKYENYLREKMPPISFQNRAQGMIALWKEQVENLGPLVQKWPRKTGVQLVSGVQVPAPPTDPNSIDTSLIRIPLGTFQVVGSFRSIMSHIRSWNKFRRLVQIDPVSLTGPSPGMSAQYSVTVYIFPRGEAGPPVAMAGTGQAGGGVPGGMAPTGAGPAYGPMGGT